MFSSSVIKQDDLKRVEVAKVNYEQLADFADDVATPETVDGFTPLSFSDSSPQISSALLEGASQHEDSGGEQVTLTDGMEVIAKDDLQRRLESQYTSGLMEGRTQAERGLANVFKALRQSVADLDGLRDKVLRESEDDLLKLAIMIARKVIQQEIAQNPRILANIVNATIRDCSELDRITIRLNPHDYTLVAEDRQGFLGNLCPGVHLTLTPDESVGSGGCLVDTTTGIIDARIETQLDEISRRLMEDRSIVPVYSDPDEVGQNVDKG